MSSYKPRDAFMPFHLRSKRWACIVAHRRAGKTVACVNELLTRALASRKDRAQFAYIAPYFVQAKQIAWQYLLEYGAGVITKKNESELWIEVSNASGSTSRIMLFGADNSDRLRGLYLDGVVIDEPADIRPSFFGTIIRPMLADRKGWCVWIGTPKGHNEFYNIHKRSMNEKDWFGMVLKASKSGLLDAAELKDAAKDMTGDQYEQEFECSFEAVIQGSVYGKWIRGAIDKGMAKSGVYDPELPVYTAWDLGFDDLTCILFWQKAGKEIRVIHAYANSGEGIEHYCDYLKSKGYTYQDHFVPHDAANKLMAAGGRSIVQQAHALGVKMRIVAATSQMNSIEAARKTLEFTWWDSIECDEVLEAMLQYQYEYDEERQTFKTKPRHDWTSHFADAYEIIGQVWKELKPPEKPEKPRFLHEMTSQELFWPKGV